MRTYILYFFIVTSISFQCTAQKFDINSVSKKDLRKLKLYKYELNILYFLEPSCPISQKYQTIIASIDNELGNKKINSFFIFPNKFSSKVETIKFAKEISEKASIIFDQKLYFTKKIGATITPEVFLITNTGKIVYHGAIDDWYYDLGRKKREPSIFYLKNAIKNYFSNQPIIPNQTKAVGCDIEI